jgi:drug/metabolite transporter (DMT)-like permease
MDEAKAAEATNERHWVRRAPAFLLVASVAFAASGPLARYGRPAHPLVLAAGRVAVAAVVMLALERRGALRALRTLPPRALLAIAGAGALLGAHFALFQWGLERTSLPAAVSLVSLEPASVVLTAWAAHGLRPTRGEAAGVGLATLGAFVLARGSGIGEHRLEGDLLVLGAVALYGVYVSAARAFQRDLGARVYAAFVYASAALSLGLMLAVLGARGMALGAVPPHSVGAIVALALLPTIVGHTAVQAAAKTMSPSIVALVSPGETLGAIAIGMVALGAIPSRAEAIGALIIAAGATVAILSSARQARGERSARDASVSPPRRAAPDPAPRAP